MVLSSSARYTLPSIKPRTVRHMAREVKHYGRELHHVLAGHFGPWISLAAVVALIVLAASSRTSSRTGR
jgi:hypothetical protein